MLKVGRSFILSIGPVGFAPTMACSVEIVCFAMEEWLIHCGVGNILSAPILDSPLSIKWISRSEDGELHGVDVLLSEILRRAGTISGGACGYCGVWGGLRPISGLSGVCFKINVCW